MGRCIDINFGIEHRKRLTSFQDGIVYTHIYEPLKWTLCQQLSDVVSNFLGFQLDEWKSYINSICFYEA